MNGDGIVRNPSAAYSMTSAAAAKSDLQAMFLLGKWGTEGKLQKVPTILWANYLRSAADRGHVKAQELLGRWYTSEQPTVIQIYRAYVYLRLAKMSGATEVDQLLDNLSRIIGPLHQSFAEEDAEKLFESIKEKAE